MYYFDGSSLIVARHPTADHYKWTAPVEMEVHQVQLCVHANFENQYGLVGTDLWGSYGISAV